MAVVEVVVAAFVVALVVVLPLFYAIGGVRDAVDRQTRTIERIGRAAGWLPPER